MAVQQKTQIAHEGTSLFDVVAVATRYSLKPEHKDGHTQFRGKNFIDPAGSQSQQFLLYDTGVARDFKLNTTYTPSHVAQAAGEATRTSPLSNDTGDRPSRKPKKSVFDWATATAIYDYTDEAGRLLFQVGRQGHGATKDIRQRRPDARREATGVGGWLYSLGNVRRTLYRLNEVLAARVVLIVEGEKAVDAIRDELARVGLLGEFAVTTNPHGAGNWRDELTPSLEGKEVFIFPDEGDKGAQHGADVAARVLPVAKSLRVVDLPGLPPKGGADDWLNNGRTFGEMFEISEAVPLWALPTSGATIAEELPYTLDDIGNGQRFAAEHRHELRFCATRESWQVYKGGRWTNDEHGAAESRAKQTARKAVEEAATVKDLDARFKLLRHATTLTKRATRSTMIQDASSEDGMRVVSSDFDTDPYLFNCANGTLDLRTCEFRGHRPEDLLTHQSPVVYDASAKAEVWERAMERWMPDAAKRNYVQDCVGATLCGVLFEESWNFVFGEGENGKGKFFYALETMLGSYGHKTEAETFMLSRDPKKSSAPNPSLLALKGARMVTSHELENTQRMGGAIMKDITGRDTLTARGVHEKRAVTFLPQFTLWLNGNSKPVVADTSHGFWRRVRLIEFAEPLKPHEKDPLLGQKFEAELAGILNWALIGWRRVQRYGIIVPDVVNMATAQYRQEQDPLLEFLTQCCDIAPSATSTSKELWEMWCVWCEGNLQEPRTQKWLGTQLKERRFTSFPSGPIRKWRGISLKESFLKNAHHASHVSLTNPNDADDADDARVSENIPKQNKPQKSKKGKHQDFEPYTNQ